MSGAGRDEQLQKSIVEAGPLLEHTRWVLSDLGSRIESFNQRAGVLLGVSVAVAALVVPSVAAILPGAVAWLAAPLVAAPFLVPVGFSLATLRVRSGHGIGPRVILQLQAPDHYPSGLRGDHVERDLFHSLTAPTVDGDVSVLVAMNRECERKGTLLERTQWAFAGAVAASALMLLTSGFVNQVICGRWSSR